MSKMIFSPLHIVQYGIYPTLVLLQQLEDEGNYEKCAEIVRSIKLLSSYTGIDYPTCADDFDLKTLKFRPEFSMTMYLQNIPEYITELRAKLQI